METTDIIVKSPTLVQVRLNQERYPRLKNIPMPDAIKGLASIVTTAYMYSGRMANEKDIYFIATALHKEMMLDEDNLGMPNISLEEIGRAIKKAVLGQGREMYGISVASLYSTVADYCKGEGLATVREIAKMNEEQRMRELKESALGALIETGARALLQNSKTTRK